MTTVEARAIFFRDTIVVQVGADKKSQEVREWLSRVFRSIPEAKIEFAEVEGCSPCCPKVFHMGDVILGQRINEFVSYAQWLGS
jgi:hypothetical protein